MYRTVSLLVYTFGLAAFLGLFVLWLRQLRLGRPELRGWLYPAIFLSSAAWFALNLLTLEYFILLAGACVFPALLGKLFHARGIPFLAIGSIAVAAVSLLHERGLLPLEHARRDLSAAFCVLIIWGCATAARRTPGGRVNAWLLAGAAALVPLAMYTYADWLSLLMRSLPLTLLIVDSYTRRRFLFLDLFAKWGSYFALALTALVLWFRIMPQSMHPIQLAIFMLPLMWGVPRVCRFVGVYMDRHVLGRPYSPAQAQRLFLEGLQRTDTERQLLAEAPRLLEEIFRTRATISAEGLIQLDERPDGRPLFSEDLDLLKTLSEMLRFLLENRRLEERRRDLLLEASRSELKALRAQISPHFLFNALNTVAELIPSDPGLAEETVEKLAEVFRYTLKRSDAEMAPLCEEIEFIRAWLGIQHARFGDRLEIHMQCAADTLAVRIPTMALETLVENALKHGVARSAEPCRVTIRTERNGDTLRLSVTDTGPGPVETGSPGGHGLRNVRERLAGYYGERGRLTLARDEARGETNAVIEIPL